MKECEDFCLDSTQYFEKYLPGDVNKTGKLSCSWKTSGDVFFNTTQCFATNPGSVYPISDDQSSFYTEEYFFEYNLGDYASAPAYSADNYSYQRGTIDNLIYIIINANTWRQFE